MDAEWITSPTARRILMHWADPRPAWLWSHDGSTLLWRNPTARYFHGRLKKHGLKLSPEAVPIKGQISRLIRLGAPGRSSLSRIQFLAGDKPVSTTCSCTPLVMPGGEVALLIAGVDPIDPELLDAPQSFPADRLVETLFPAGSDYLLVDDGQIRGGSSGALERLAPEIEERGFEDLPESGEGEIEIGGERLRVVRLRASPQDATLLVFVPEHADEAIANLRVEEGEADGAVAETRLPVPNLEPLLPLDLPDVPEAPVAPTSTSDLWVEPVPPSGERSLTSLFDRLADDADLYSTLTEADETLGARPEPPAQETVAEAPEAPKPDLIADIIEYADDPEDVAPRDPVQWQITGRGFTPIARPAEPPTPELTVDAAPDSETAERVSRYNFEELSRILTDRVAIEPSTEIEAPIAPPQRTPPAAAESVVNLNAEALVLNRLPLGILLFRDQQVLFANRALVELTGHDSVEQLRTAGIASIFPSESGADAGPVSQLVRRNGTLMPVNARLQTVSWQGRSAVMLTAQPLEARVGHEGAVRAFAEIAADAREEGFITTDRSGLITLVSGHGRVLLGTPESDLVGKPLTVLLAPANVEALRVFLERPARFAETTRPSFVTATVEPGIEMVLFAEGQAGIVTGYFGFLRRLPVSPAATTSDSDVEPSILGRLSRGLRRPLNTIIGFADLIRSGTSADTQRTLEYARDIKTAGTEIAALVDELDDFARLRDGSYAPRPSDVDLTALLESCMLRVKGQAGTARVLVRSAISERLPRIRADRASLGQAVLNLLASAIDQTPAGGSVILSAQWQDDGGIAVHVRDGATINTDMGERFVVFRDGVGKDGEQLAPVRSSVGLALTRSLLAVNACSLSVDPTAGVGTLFSLVIPADLIVQGK